MSEILPMYRSCGFYLDRRPRGCFMDIAIWRGMMHSADFCDVLQTFFLAVGCVPLLVEGRSGSHRADTV